MIRPRHHLLYCRRGKARMLVIAGFCRSSGNQGHSSIAAAVFMVQCHTRQTDAGLQTPALFFSTTGKHPFQIP